jgi:hypothetical protein
MNRVKKLLSQKPFTFAICHNSLYGMQCMAIIAKYEPLYQFDHQTIEGRVNLSLKEEKFCKQNKEMKEFPYPEKIGELDLNDDEKNWVLENRIRFNTIKVDGGIIYELPESSFKSMFTAKGDLIIKN